MKKRLQILYTRCNKILLTIHVRLQAANNSFFSVLKVGVHSQAGKRTINHFAQVCEWGAAGSPSQSAFACPPASSTGNSW